MKNFFSNIKYDFPASIVVFLVAVPLCLGIALASGAPSLFSGIISGIVGGTVVALLSGSQLGVSGPAAGLAVIVLTAINELGSFEIFLLAVLIAGLIQIGLGIAKAGVIGYYFPSSVIKGMLSGIGVIIFLKQIPHALGYDADPEGDFEFFQRDGETTFTELSKMFDFISPGATLVAVVSLAILILWEQGFMKKLPITRLIQGPLVVVTGGILFNLAFAGDSFLGISNEHTVNIPVAESFGGFVAQFTFPDFSQWNNPQVYIIAFTIAIVASLETLLCVEAADKLDPQKRITPTNRELIAQGVGNMISGLIGGLPVTQVIVRSSANVQSGAKTKASAFFHGILLLITAIAIPSILNLIPLASLAAILLVVGYKLASPTVMKAVYKQGMGQFVPFLVTLLGIVFTDLLVGISLGMAVGVVQILWNNYQVPYHVHLDEDERGKFIRISLAEDVSFLNKARILHTFNDVPDGARVVIDGTKNKTMHPDVEEIISDFKLNALTRDVQIEYINEGSEMKMTQKEAVEKLSEVHIGETRNDQKGLN